MNLSHFKKHSLVKWTSLIKVLPLCALISMNAWAKKETKEASDEYLPTSLLQLDDYFTHHVFVAEKSTHQLHLFRNNNGIPEHIGQSLMATGKKAGDKSFQGDHRTPEGVYFLTDFIARQELLRRHGKEGEIYGVGAFVLNFPNPMDSQEGKTGSGIWLHSTNDETRIEKGLDSRGCIVTANGKLIELSQYIELNRTPIVVVHELKYLSRNAWETNRNKVRSTILDWADAWGKEDLNRYLSHYHPKEFSDSVKGNFNNFKNYKKAVFSKPGKPDVRIENISLMTGKDYLVANLTQIYNSDSIKDVGKKTLYLKQDEYYEWKIVAEMWTKAGIGNSNDPMAFQPSMRFFTTNDPQQILGTENKSSKN